MGVTGSLKCIGPALPGLRYNSELHLIDTYIDVSDRKRAETAARRRDPNLDGNPQ